MSNAKAAFLGPQAENDRFFEDLLLEVFRDYVYWRRNFHPLDRRVIREADKRERSFEESMGLLRQELFSVLSDLKRGVPLYSPRHLGHMVSDQLMAGQIGYVAAMLYNQNNVTGETSPVTTRRELEYMDALAAMIGMRPVARTPREAGSWGHLASGGTVANLEALWVARNLKLYPVSLRLLALQERRFDALRSLEVALPSGRTAPLGALPCGRLLQLAPGEAYDLRARAAACVADGLGLPAARAQEEVDAAVRRHSVQALGTAGLAAACARLGEPLPPLRVYLSRTAHYCWKKGLDLIGIGQDALVPVDVDEGYRLRVDDLERRLDPSAATLMVVGIVGTTEEGAVDPLHELVALRERLAREREHSFWIHADAAYGGYFAALLPEREAFPAPDGIDGEAASEEIRRFFRALLAEARMPDPFEPGAPPVTAPLVRHLHALSRVDSAVVDPHKLGFLPYPAGAVLFADGRAKEAVSYDAPYLAWQDETGEAIERKFLGRWTLEGSRPGASAVACSLAHRLMPHDRSGYGAMVAQTMIGARRLHLALERFNRSAEAAGLRILPLCPPETNVLCYLVAAPGTIRHPHQLGALAQEIYDGMTVRGNAPIQDYDYFISRTSIDFDRYRANLEALLAAAGIPGPHRAELEGGQLTVLRSVVMNPLVFDLDDSFFDDFWRDVARHARRALPAVAATAPREEPAGV